MTPHTGHGHFIPISALLDFAATSFGVSFLIRFLLCGGFFFLLVLALVGVLLHDLALVLPAVDACALATLAAVSWLIFSLGFSFTACVPLGMGLSRDLSDFWQLGGDANGKVLSAFASWGLFLCIDLMRDSTSSSCVSVLAD